MSAAIAARLLGVAAKVFTNRRAFRGVSVRSYGEREKGTFAFYHGAGTRWQFADIDSWWCGRVEQRVSDVAGGVEVGNRRKREWHDK